MKPGGGSAKGATFERFICKELSKWWTEGKRDDVFWRTAGSGGRATNRAKTGKTTAGAYGDITALDPIGEPLLKLFCFELKCGYGGWDVLDLIDKGKNMKHSKLQEFWQQASESAQQAHAHYPVVIAKRNQKQPVIVFPIEFREAVTIYHGPFLYPFLRTRILCDPVFICLFSDFLDYVDPKTIYELGKVKDVGFF